MARANRGAMQYMGSMGSATNLMCRLFGHRRDGRRAWHDSVSWRAPCVRCGAPMIKDFLGEWRLFEGGDVSVDRLGRDDDPAPDRESSHRQDLHRPDDAVVQRALQALAGDEEFLALVKARAADARADKKIFAACRLASGHVPVSAATIDQVRLTAFRHEPAPALTLQ